MRFSNTPLGWARKLTHMMEMVGAEHDIHHFPINVEELAVEYSEQIFPNDPVLEVVGEHFSEGIEGMISSLNEKAGWIIIYNLNIANMGRRNFTIAHEFGHYLLHRSVIKSGKQCSRNDMNNWRENEIEAEANLFASNLLLPAKDVSRQIVEQRLTAQLIHELANRYGASLEATTLRVADVYRKPAMVVKSRDGFIDWAISNERLMKTGVYYSAKQQIVELPPDSLAFQNNDILDDRKSHAEGVWPGSGKVEEILIYGSDEFSLSLLLYESSSTKGYSYAFTEDEEEFL